MRKPREKFSIYKKFFLSMSLISAALILIFLVSTTLVIYNHFTKSTSKYSMAQLDYISTQLEYYMDSTQNYARAVMTDEIIQERLEKYNTDRGSFNAMDSMYLRRSVNQIIQSTPFIHSVTFYSPERELITTTALFPSDTTMAEPTNDASTWHSLMKNSNTIKNNLIYTLSMTQPLYSVSSGAPLGYIEIAIPESTIAAIYSANTDEDNHIFMVDKQGIVQSSGGGCLPLGVAYDVRTSQTLSLTQAGITFTYSIPRLDWYLVNCISLIAFFRPLFSLLIITILIAAFCGLLCYIASRKLSNAITSPIYSLIAHTQKISRGDWSMIDTACDDRDIRLLFSEFNAMIQAQENLKNNLLESDRLKNQISLDLLQQQVNPHFLYNTLDNICSLAELDEKQTLIDIVMCLSTFYRVGLSSGKFRVTIGDELEITSVYLHIMQIRYFNKFEYNIKCPEDLKHYSCIKLLLQPIVENSIYHGIKELSCHGLLEVDISSRENKLYLVVQDNGVGYSKEDYERIWNDSDHFGVKNIHQRIQLYYGEEYGLTMKNRETGGCITIITIPREEVVSDVNENTDSG